MSEDGTAETLVHGTGLVLAGTGLVITGPSGSGKSLLALDLIDHAQGHGEDAFLVADDAVLIAADTSGDAIMRAPRTIAGLIELRGRGLIAVPHRQSASVHLWVELVDETTRMPEESDFVGSLAGIALARCPVPRRGLADPVHQRLLVRAGLPAHK